MLVMLFFYILNHTAKLKIFYVGETADHRLFEKQIEFFESTFNCLVWDAPAHGKSRPFKLEFSMEDMATYLYKILEIEKFENGILIGQSLGGYIAQVFMEQYPKFANGFISPSNFLIFFFFFLAFFQQ